MDEYGDSFNIPSTASSKQSDNEWLTHLIWIRIIVKTNYIFISDLLV